MGIKRARTLELELAQSFFTRRLLTLQLKLDLGEQCKGLTCLLPESLQPCPFFEERPALGFKLPVLVLQETTRLLMLPMG